MCGIRVSCACSPHILSCLLVPSDTIILVLSSRAGSYRGWLFYAGNWKNGLVAFPLPFYDRLPKFSPGRRLWSPFLTKTTQGVNQYMPNEPFCVPGRERKPTHNLPGLTLVVAALSRPS